MTTPGTVTEGKQSRAMRPTGFSGDFHARTMRKLTVRPSVRWQTSGAAVTTLIGKRAMPPETADAMETTSSLLLKIIIINHGPKPFAEIVRVIEFSMVINVSL